MGHKKLFFLFLLVGMFLVSLSSAMEADNGGSYDEKTRTFTFRNGCAFETKICVGSVIGTATLNTPMKNEVGLGYQKVAEFELSAYEDYNDILKSIEFYDMNKDDWENHKLQKNFDIKYKIIDINEFGFEVERWEKVTPAVLKKNEKVVVGIFTFVEFGDYVEWVPQIYGVEVDEWASYVYSGTSFSVAAQDVEPLAITYHDDKLQVMSDNLKYVYEYHLNGTYTGFSFTLADPTQSHRAMTWDGTHYFVGSTAGSIRRYTSTGTSLGQIVNVGKSVQGLAWDGTYFWVLDDTTDTIYKYNSAWAYQSFSFTVPEVGLPRGLGWDGEFLWAVSYTGSDDKVFAYYPNGTYSNNFFPMDEDSLPNGVASENGNLWVLGDTNNNAYKYEIDNFPPTVLQISPDNNTAYSISPQLINFTCYGSDEKNLTSMEFYLDEILNETNSSGLNNTNYTFPRSLEDGNYNWSCTGEDDFGGRTETGIRFLSIDGNAPTINITAPIGTSDYFELGNNETLNVTITDPNLDSCWYSYNGTNITIESCLTGIQNSKGFVYELGINNITVYANDTNGNMGSSFTSWDYQFLETVRTFNPIALQTSTESFILTGVKDSSITSTSAVFTYDGGNYTALKTGSGDDVVFTSALAIPTTLSGNIDFFWTITYTNSTGTYSFQTTNSTQEVYSLSLEECFAPTIDGLTLNFTTYDTTNMTALDSVFEATFQFYAEGGSGSMIVEYLFSDLNENRSNYMFCLNSSGQNVTLDAFISYAATDYDRREYILDDGIIGNFTQDIPLYLTLTELTDIVTVTVQDQTFDPIAGALVAIQEWNVGTNTYSTVGMLTTSSSGQGIIDLELYTTWYRAVVYIDGVLTHVEDVQKLSTTSWIITVETGEDNPYDLFGNIAHGLTFDNSTNTTSFTWLDISGYTNRGCMIVQNTTSLGPVTIFNSCLTSVSGTIDYQIVGDGNYVAYGIIFLEGYDVSQIVDELPIRLGTPELTEKVSPFGKVISFISIGTAGLMGVAAGSAIFGGVLVIAVLIFLMKAGFLNISWGFIWGIIMIMILVWVLQRRKR